MSQLIPGAAALLQQLGLGSTLPFHPRIRQSCPTLAPASCPAKHIKLPKTEQHSRAGKAAYLLGRHAGEKWRSGGQQQGHHVQLAAAAAPADAACSGPILLDPGGRNQLPALASNLGGRNSGTRLGGAPR